jgi:hypothetical protein
MHAGIGCLVGLAGVDDSRYKLDTFWTPSYKHLKRLVANHETTPDLLLVDFLVDAAMDILYQYDIPIAVLYSQIPTSINHAPYIPAQPGFQIDGTPTPDNASIWSRLGNKLLKL